MFIKTISKEVCIKYSEKKSVFVAYLYKVSSEDECQEKLAFLRQKHKDASHIPFAYRLRSRDDSIKFRFSDDGEPSKTAGFPLLKILEQEDLVNVSVFVVRFFGGIKLGPAGLMRAFSRSLHLALDSSGIVEVELLRNCIISCPIQRVSVVESFLKKRNLTYSISSQENSSSLRVSFSVAEDDDSLEGEVRRLIS